MNVRQTHVTAVAQDAAADPLRIEVSAFVDNELDDEAVERVIDAMLASDELADFWTDAHRAGDWLRSEEVIDVGDGDAFLARFSARLASEPAIIAAKKRGGRSRARRFWLRTGLPGASVAAALVVVAWVAVPSAGGDRKTAVASVAIVPAGTSDGGSSGVQSAGYTTTVDADRAAPVDPDRLNDYVAAHRDVTPFAYRGMSASARPATFNATPASNSPDGSKP